MGTITAAVCAENSLYDLTPAVAADLAGSGFDTIVAFALHVDASGDITYNQYPVVTGGAYVGPSGWAGQLAGLKEGSTTVNRLLFSVGGAGATDFASIQTLIQKHGTGPESPLYQGFQQLRRSIPAIDGIDFDDEGVLDADTIVRFAQMLNCLGYQVTFCPYQEGEIDLWVGCLSTLNGATPGLVTQFNLQCYGGGSGDSPRRWIDAIRAKMGPDFDARGFVFPGLECRAPADCLTGECPDTVRLHYDFWGRVDGVRGGFIWRYEHIGECAGRGGCLGPNDTAAYAGAILKGLGG